jgi:hypothetical protein
MNTFLHGETRVGFKIALALVIVLAVIWASVL